MRARLIGALASGAALVLTAMVTSPAAAIPADWTVTPQGSFVGTAGITKLYVQEADVELSCSSSTATGTADSGPNPIATIPQSPGIQFFNCTGPFGLTFTVQQVGNWLLNGSSYNATTGVTTGQINNITANITGPGCNAKVTGFVNATFTNSTDVLAVLPNFTLVVSYVDPANPCLGLIFQGDHASFSGSYKLNKNLTVTSP